MKNTDENIYNKKYYRAKKASNEILDTIENNTDSSICPEFEDMMSENSLSAELLDDMVDQDKHLLYFEELNNTDKEADIKNLVNNIHSLKRHKTRRRIIYTISSVAAAMIAVSLLVYDSGKQGVDNRIILSEEKKIDIKKPILIFDSGDTVIIDSGNGHIKEMELMASGEKIDSSASKYNTIIIPTGHTYKLLLADGTRVTLNAESRLRYPTAFGGDSREVELEGEAYFDVTKSDKRFIVNSYGNKIEVFGTQFNVRSNPNGDMETVLVEGSIGFKPKHGVMSMITPGTRLSFVSKNSSVATEKVDLYTYTAWLDNKFVFKEQPLARVISDIAKWHGIQVSSLKPIDDLTLTLVINRDTPVDDLMRVISLTLNINIIKENGMKYTIE